MAEQDNWELRPVGQTPKIPKVPFEHEAPIEKITGDINVKDFKTENPQLNWEVKSLPTDQNITESNWKDTARKYVAPIVRGAAVTGGSTIGATGAGLTALPTVIGAAPAAVAGGFTGGVAGDQVYQLLQRFMPRVLGSPPNNLKDSLVESGINSGVNEVAGPLINKTSSILASGLPKTLHPIENLKQGIQNLFPVNPNIGNGEIQKALTDSAGLELKPTVGQVTQNSAATHLEDILKPQEKLEKFTLQQKKLLEQAQENLAEISKGRFTGIKTAETSPADIGASATAGAKELYESAKNSEKARWNNLTKVEVPKLKKTVYEQVESEIEPTQDQILDLNNPIPKTETKLVPKIIEGPIQTNATTNFARNVFQQVQTAIENQPDPNTKSYLQGLLARVEPLTKLPKDENGISTIGFEAAKDLKDRFKILSKGKDAPPEVKREIGLIGALGDLLGKDINDSINTTWPSNARQAFNRATTKTKQIAETFYNKQGNDLLDYTTSNQAALEHALSSKEAALQFKKATGRGVELGTEFTRNILDKALDADGKFDGKKALELFAKDGDIANIALTSTQRSSLTNLFRRMQSVNPELVMSGQAAVAIRKLGAIFGIGGGLLSGLASGNVSTGVMTGSVLLGSLELSKPIVEKLFLNPKNANLMAILSHLPPQTSKAQEITKTLFKTALRGAQFQTQYGNMQVNDEGKLESVKPAVQ